MPNVKATMLAWFFNALALIFLMCFSTMAFAETSENNEVSKEEAANKAHWEEKVEAYFEASIEQWIHDPYIIEAISTQNSHTQDLTEADILKLDKKWREQLNDESRPLIDRMTSGRVAELLLARISAAGGVISELFIMDAQGLNVATAMPTSDYWQGDEAKFQKTFLKGITGFHISDLNFDPSTGVSQLQVSATISNPVDLSPIGAITIGLIADLLM